MAQAQVIQWEQNPANQHWYGLPNISTTWLAGEAIAVQAGGQLVTIRSAAENAFLASLLSGINVGGFWIGLNDANVEGTFVWSSGEPVTYTNWNPGEPNGGAALDWCRMSQPVNFRWEDGNGGESNIFAIVESLVQPAGSWSLPRTVSVGSGPAYPAIGDLNGDSWPDYVVPNRNTNTLSVILGQSSGSFAPAVTVTTGSGPNMAVMADFDGDSSLDVAVACSTPPMIRIHFGNGLGGFTSTQNLVHAGNGAALVAIDVDQDGRVDLAETTAADRLLIWRNDASSGFTVPAVYATGSGPFHLASGDLNQDGRTDLVASNYTSNDLSIFLGQPGGTFTSSALLARGINPGRVAIADYNADTFVDLAIPLRSGGLKVMWGAGNGTFDTQGPVFPTSGDADYALAADFNNDGRKDVAVSLLAAGRVAVFMTVPVGVFQLAAVLRSSESTQGLGAVDFDQDGFVDLAFTSTQNNKLGFIRRIARDCNANGFDDQTDISLGTSLDCNANSIPDECDLAQPATFDCDGNAVVDSCEIANNPALDLDADQVLDECENVGTPFCLGDGTGAACPCDPGQAGPPGRGCGNSIGSGGLLKAVGNASVTADSVSLRASGMPSTVGLFFQGAQPQSGGIGSFFGDGLLCANVNVIRMMIRAAPAGTMVFGRDEPTDPTISSAGFVPPAGGARYYQVWYRDSAPFCQAANYNLSNGLRIDWTP